MIPLCIFLWTFRTTKGNRSISQESRKGSVLSLGGLEGGGGPRFRQVDRLLVENYYDLKEKALL